MMQNCLILYALLIARILRRGRVQSRLRPFRTLEYLCLATHGSDVSQKGLRNYSVVVPYSE